jgi:preprotein translocase subunit SecA
VALEDEFMRLFGGDRMTNIMDRVGFTDETPIEAGILSRSIENAQKKVENHNYEIRKSVLEYDDVMNKQREIIYADRRAILESKFPTRDFIVKTIEGKVDAAVDRSAPENVHPEEWDLEEILNELDAVWPVKSQVTLEELEKLDRAEMKAKLSALGTAAYEAKEQEITPELMRIVESQYIMLPLIDRLWIEHLQVMDHLKSGIGLRGYGQKDPRVEYEREAYEIFEDLKNNIADETVKQAFRVVIEIGPPPEGFGENGETTSPSEPEPSLVAAGVPFEQLPTGSLAPHPVNGSGGRIDGALAEHLLGPAPGSQQNRQMHTNRDEPVEQKPARAGDKVGRNDLCPCGSGKKYKRCHGAAA